MASHHHHHHHQTNHHCCCCCCSCCTIPSDPLVQAIATQLIQAQLSYSHPQSQHPQHPNLFSHHFFPQYLKQSPPQNLHNPPFQQPKHRFHQQNQQQEGEQNQRTNSVISSLLQRIDALESSFQHFSSSSSYFSNSLRDRAARTIQTHFRAHLVRRSRTLRQLKDLAFIKSRFISIKSSISDQTHFDFEDASQKATDLLLKLDSIQGFDPMIRDNKRSISRELVRFLEFIDEVLTRRREISRKWKKSLGFSRNRNKSRVLFNSALSGDKRSPDGEIGGSSRNFGDVDGDVEIDNEENPNPRSRFPRGVLVKKDKLEPRMKKSVSFAEDRNVVRAFSQPNDACSNGRAGIIYGDDSIDDERVPVENLGNGIEEVGAFSWVSDDDEDDDSDEDMENGGSSQISAGEQIPRRNLRIYDEVSEHHQGQNGNIVFSAPMPEKMESRADLIKRKNVKYELSDGP